MLYERRQFQESVSALFVLLTSPLHSRSILPFVCTCRIKLLAMSLLSPPSANIDWAKLSLENIQPCSHIECSYSASTKEWSEPRVVEEPYLKVHGWAPGLHYGQQCYEGLKAFRTSDDRILVFRPGEHAKRLIHSASRVALTAPPNELFIKCVNLAVESNAGYVPPHHIPALFYIRPLLFGNGPRISIAPPLEATFCVFVQPAFAYHGFHAVNALIMEDFDRAAPRGVGNAKVGGNYAPVIPYGIRALEQGFPVTLHLDSETRTDIEEFSTSAFLGVLKSGDSITLVAPSSNNVVHSITSESSLVIAEKLGWKTEQRVIKYTELANFKEVFAAGTAASLLPIRSITRHSTSDKFDYGEESEKVDSVFAILSKALSDVQHGVVQDEYGWTHSVSATKHINGIDGKLGELNGDAGKSKEVENVAGKSEEPIEVTA